MFLTANNLAWGDWVRGVLGAIISGGAATVGGGFAAVVTSPSGDFTPGQGGTVHLLTLMGLAFLFSGIISLAKFLQLHPVPDVLQKNLATAQAENTLSRDAAIRAGRAITDAQNSQEGKNT